jgi:hypothetical protein
VKLNGILECRFLSEKRAPYSVCFGNPSPSVVVQPAGATWGRMEGPSFAAVWMCVGWMCGCKGGGGRWERERESADKMLVGVVEWEVRACVRACVRAWGG